MKLSPLSLRSKLIGFAASLVLVPGVVLGVLADRSARDSLQQVIGRQLAREAFQTADRVAIVLRRERETLHSFARQDLMREIRVADIDKRVSQALRTLRNGGAARRDYVVVDPSGSVVAGSSPALLGAVPPWAAALDLDVAARDEAVSLSTGASGLVLATRVPDPDGGSGALGVLIGLIGWPLLTEVTSSVGRDLSAQETPVSVVVVRPDGAVLGRSPGLSGFAPAPERWAGVRDALAGGSGYAVDAGADVIVGSAPLAPELPDWTLWVVEPLEYALAPSRQLTRRLAALMGVALALALGIAAIGSQRVIRPLSELTRAIRGVARGTTRGVSVPVRSTDEVGTLAQAFNRMMADLERVQRNLVEAEKFAFVGELASRVAHEVRTSLGVLRSSAQLLEKSLPRGGDETMTELVQMIRAEVDRLSGVVDDLLTLDRPRPLHLEPTPLSLPVLRAVDFVAPRAAEKQIGLVRTLPAESPVVHCDAEAIQQVCVNLLVNALDALQSGGRLEAEISSAGERHASFRIRDDGPGVPAELRERIFEPFVTGREDGVGLGLTSVKRVVHEHQGEICLEPVPGGGACFRVDLPLAEGAA